MLLILSSSSNRQRWQGGSGEKRQPIKAICRKAWEATKSCDCRARRRRLSEAPSCLQTLIRIKWHNQEVWLRYWPLERAKVRLRPWCIAFIHAWRGKKEQAISARLAFNDVCSPPTTHSRIIGHTIQRKKTSHKVPIKTCLLLAHYALTLYLWALKHQSGCEWFKGMFT